MDGYGWEVVWKSNNLVMVVGGLEVVGDSLMFCLMFIIIFLNILLFGEDVDSF